MSTPTADALARYERWQQQVASVLLAAGFEQDPTPQQVWDALEPHGLNGGFPRPETAAPRSRSPRRPRPAAVWQALIAQLEQELDQISERERARVIRRHGRSLAITDHIPAAIADRIRLERRLEHARRMLQKAADQETEATTDPLKDGKR